MYKRVTAAIAAIIICILSVYPVEASEIKRQETPNYKVAFYPYDCYHMQDENGRKSGYGYEMMQGIAEYMQSTFSYIGYDNSASECVEMLRNGELDIYTAAKRTPEREAEFAFSEHPAITSSTCMNVKVGNTSIVAGDYSTYDGIRVGLLRRHTYNNAFLAFTEEKGFDCEIIYYDTPTELTQALINDEVDALVNSYIGIPEDERTIENFGETPYYIMARKEDKELIERIDYAIDCMNVEKPNWRTELYNKYYGSEESNTEFTKDELELLEELKSSDAVIRAVTNPNANPYSWNEDGEMKGIAVDIFKAVADELGLGYEILQVSTKEEYEAALASGDVDVWMDVAGYYEDTGYKVTQPYLSTTVSILRVRGSNEKTEKLVVCNDDISINEIIGAVWSDAEITVLDTPKECMRYVLEGRADGAVLMSYMAQRLAKDDIQNRFSVDIVPGAEIELMMGVNSEDSYHFYGLWEKTLTEVSQRMGAEILQRHLEVTSVQTITQYMFNHPLYLMTVCMVIFALLVMILLNIQSVKSKNRQQKIAGELAAALDEAKKATESRQNFFSKMSHDIRTPLNVVLGMTQVAQKYKHDPDRLDNALDKIAVEGRYLLMLINSILDVNQLEHGMIDLASEPFNPADSVMESVGVLKPLADKKEQSITVDCECTDRVVLGDDNRLKQIIINIVSNAIKYTDDGGHIVVKLESLPQNVYRFSCEDDGIGMSEEFVKHICEDFVRAEDSRVSKIQGTGLGMSVVKGFTELMGGTLKIESELGKGSRITVELPFEDASDEQKRNYFKPADNGKSDDEYEGRKVLLVEDNVLNAEIAMELLQSLKMNVVWAENGASGVECYEASGEGEFFAIFMDMQMPVMDGVEAAQKIRGSGRKDSGIPIFAMTANTFDDDRKRCREAGMDGYIPKPISADSIREALKEHT